MSTTKKRVPIAGRRGKQSSLNCDHCGEVFTWKHEFLIHSTFNCGKRRKSYSKYRRATRHESVAPAARGALECDTSGTVFDSDPKFQVRNEQRLFSCNECGKSFKQRSSIQEHLLIVHSEERPFSCSECDSKFKRKKTLNGHVLCVHRQERPFRCVECDSTFKRKDHLQRHVFDVHYVGGSFACQTDGKVMRKSKCVKGVRRRESYGYHHLFSCKVCDSTFERKDHFRRHVLKEHRARGLVTDVHVGTEMQRKRRSRKSDIRARRSVLPVENQSFRCRGCGAEMTSEKDICVHCGRAGHDQNENISNDAIHQNVLEGDQQHFQSLSVVCSSENDSVDGMAKGPEEWTGYASESTELHEPSDTNLPLRRKSVIHEGGIVFPCELCGETFNLKMKLRQHFKRKHFHSQRIPENNRAGCRAATDVEEGNETLKQLPINRERSQLVASCPSCLESFAKYNELIDHARKCEKYASVAKEEMERSRDVVIERREYGCSICGSTLLDAEPMNAHLKAHGTNFYFHMCKPCPCEDGTHFIICH